MEVKVAAIVLTALFATSAQAEVVLRCAVTEKHICQMGVGCASAAPTEIHAWGNFYPASRAYERCDPKGCDRYEAAVSQSGVFTNVEIPGKAAFIKIGPDGVFNEVATSGLTDYISFGRCAIPPTG